MLPNMRLKHALIATCLVALASTTSFAQENKGFEPIYGSLKADEVNVRSGPGTQYPILVVYRYRGYPVQAIAQYDTWYKIRDVEGEEGWIYRGFFSRQHTVMVSAGEPITLHKDSQGKHPLLRLEQGVIAPLDGCEGNACRIELNNYKGWVDKGRLLMVE